MPPASAEMLLFAFEYPPCSGGISRLCGEIGAGFARKHVKMQVLTQYWDTGEGTPLEGSCQTRVPARRPHREWAALAWLNRRRRRSAPVICGLWYPEGLLTTIAGVKPRVVLAHGAELMPAVDRWRRPLWRILQKWVLESAALVVANSEYTGRLVTAVAPKARVAIAPLAVDHHRFSPCGRETASLGYQAADRRVICTVARLYEYKGIDVVLRAIALLSPQEREQIVYLVAGRGPDDTRLRALARELGIESVVRWLGFVPEQDLPNLYRAADLFILCTREDAAQRGVEGFGLVFLEAQACGTPVVGTNAGGIPDAIKPGQSGWLVEQNDVPTIAALFRDLVHSPEAFRRAGIAGRKRIEQECTWDRYIDRFSAMLEERAIL